jgi:hypothetical protein
MSTTALIEAIARAIADGIGDDFDHAHRSKPHWIEARGESGGRYRDINEPRQPDYIDAAQAALTAITEAGYAVVPVAKMDDLVIAAGNHWGAGSEQHNLVRDMADLIAKHRPIVPAIIEAGEATR